MSVWQLLASLFAVVVVLGQTTDFERLAPLYNDNGGIHWHNKTNWLNENISVCEWYGVTCNDDGLAASLSLENNNLQYQLSPQVFSNWTTVTFFLSLAGNLLRSQIPSEIGEDINLVQLNLSSNRFLTTVPTEFGNLLKLTILDLHSLGYTNSPTSGYFPTELGNLQELQFFDFSYNYPATGNGAIPTQFGNLKNVQVMNFTESGFIGSLPSEFGNLEELRFLSLQYNFLQDRIPEEISNAHSLTYLDLSLNSLNSKLPASLGDFPNLQYLDVSYNTLFGTVPTELGNLLSLTYLDFGNNLLIGAIPSEFGQLQHLHELGMRDAGGLYGQIPSELGDIKHLEKLVSVGNKFRGTLGDWICRVPLFYFGGAHFDCPLPKCCEVPLDPEHYPEHCGKQPCVE